MNAVMLFFLIDRLCLTLMYQRNIIAELLRDCDDSEKSASDLSSFGSPVLSDSEVEPGVLPAVDDKTRQQDKLVLSFPSMSALSQLVYVPLQMLDGLKVESDQIFERPNRYAAVLDAATKYKEHMMFCLAFHKVPFIHFIVGVVLFAGNPLALQSPMSCLCQTRHSLGQSLLQHFVVKDSARVPILWFALLDPFQGNPQPSERPYRARCSRLPLAHPDTWTSLIPTFHQHNSRGLRWHVRPRTSLPLLSPCTRPGDYARSSSYTLISCSLQSQNGQHATYHSIHSEALSAFVGVEVCFTFTPPVSKLF